jgi:hypothetical protein
MVSEHCVNGHIFRDGRYKTICLMWPGIVMQNSKSDGSPRRMTRMMLQHVLISVILKKDFENHDE